MDHVVYSIRVYTMTQKGSSSCCSYCQLLQYSLQIQRRRAEIVSFTHKSGRLLRGGQNIGGLTHQSVHARTYTANSTKQTAALSHISEHTKPERPSKRPQTEHFENQSSNNTIQFQESALITGFFDCKIFYYMAFRDWNNWINENSEMAPSTSFPPLRYTENLPEVTSLRLGCVDVLQWEEAKCSLRMCMIHRGRPTDIRRGSEPQDPVASYALRMKTAQKKKRKMVGVTGVPIFSSKGQKVTGRHDPQENSAYCGDLIFCPHRRRQGNLMAGRMFACLNKLSTAIILSKARSDNETQLPFGMAGR